MDGIIAAIKKRIEECKAKGIEFKMPVVDLIERFGNYAPSLHKIT